MDKIVHPYKLSRGFKSRQGLNFSQLKIVLTYGLKEDMQFANKKWVNMGEKNKIERWYIGGSNSIRTSRMGKNGKWILNDKCLTFQKGFIDRMGCSYLRSNNTEWIWFSGRVQDSSWSIYVSSRINKEHKWLKPLLTIQPGQTTDCEHVYFPMVLLLDGLFHMWYVGRDGHHRRIHYAVSTNDGYSLNAK